LKAIAVDKMEDQLAIIVGIVSQKGGVGKSTIARLLAREFAAQDWAVKIADLDISQGTTFRWSVRRRANGIKPDIPVEQYGQVQLALGDAHQYALLVLDGAPHGSLATRDIADASDLVVIPTGMAVDDLEPAVILARDLAKHIDSSRIAFALSHVGNSERETEEVRQYLGQTSYTVLDGALPDMIGYRRAFDEGRVATETRYPGLNKRAFQLAQSIADRILFLTRESAA
jgi:chromosome partitioning protein